MFAGFYYLKLRSTPYPSLKELTLHTAIWSIIFEFLGPRALGKGVADINDIYCYLTGAIILALTIPKMNDVRGKELLNKTEYQD